MRLWAGGPGSGLFGSYDGELILKTQLHLKIQISGYSLKMQTLGQPCCRYAHVAAVSGWRVIVVSYLPQAPLLPTARTCPLLSFIHLASANM